MVTIKSAFTVDTSRGAIFEPFNKDETMAKILVKLHALHGEMKKYIIDRNFGNASSVTVEFLAEVERIRYYSYIREGDVRLCPEPFRTFIDKFITDCLVIKSTCMTCKFGDSVTMQYVNMFHALSGELMRDFAIKLKVTNVDGSLNESKLNELANTTL
jgi:hypothetical protein